MNIDKGNQSSGDENALVMGIIANSVPCGEPERWELKSFASGGESIAVRVRRAEGEEETQLWGQLVESYGPYRDYRKRTSRHLPVVVLDRI